MRKLTLTLAAGHLLDLFLGGAACSCARRLGRLFLPRSTLQLFAFFFIFHILCIHLQIDPLLKVEIRSWKIA